MKANAPEKLYIDLFKGEFNVSYSPTNNSVEYIRKDAFIEKAVGWLKLQDEMIGVSFQKDFLERFKNYMKGE